MTNRITKQDNGMWKIPGGRRALVRKAPRKGLALRNVVVTAFFALSQAVLASAPATAPATAK